jgi:hypothetical protein
MRTKSTVRFSGRQPEQAGLPGSYGFWGLVWPIQAGQIRPAARSPPDVDDAFRSIAGEMACGARVLRALGELEDPALGLDRRHSEHRTPGCLECRDQSGHPVDRGFPRPIGTDDSSGMKRKVTRSVFGTPAFQ